VTEDAPGSRFSRRVPLAVAIALAVVLARTLVGASTHWQPTLKTGMTAESKATAKPAAPGSVTASCYSSSRQKVTVSWSAVTHATSYTVWENSTSSATASVTTTSWTSATLSATTYRFKVSANFGTKWKGTKSGYTSTITISTSTPKCSG
jgi:hypothetical protein